MKKLLFPIVFLLVCSFLIMGCSSNSSALPKKDKIVVGMSRPLSGPEQTVGDSAFKVIYDTMVPMWNADGGIFIKEYNKQRDIGKSQVLFKCCRKYNH